MLSKKPDVVPPEVIPLHVNRACVNSSNVCLAHDSLSGLVEVSYCTDATVGCPSEQNSVLSF